MENRNRKDKEKETLYAITGALVLLFGAITEIVIRQMQLSLSFCDCESVSLTLIQVEAVLFGLTISLIALLSGKIETSFLGINYADYVLNKKPQIYNQITIIGGLLIVLVLSILAHMLCWYIIVMSLFLCSSILIWLSASNIYLAFTGTIQLTEEIEIYFDACLLQGSEERIALLDSLQDDWAGKIARQTTSEYTVYLEKFFLLFRYMIKNDKELEQLTKTCVVLLKTMLKDDTLYESGLSFVDRCYEEAAAFIWRNKSELRKVNNSFHLFLEVFDGFRKAVSATPVRVLERLFQFDRLTENILITNLNLGNSNNNQNAASERYALSILGAVLGMRVSEDLEHNNEYWGRALTQQFSGLEKSEDWGGVGAETIAEQKYRFILAQIDRQYDVIINKFLFAESWKLEKMDTPHAMMMLKVFCYLYYLTFYEKDDCAPNELRTFCKKFCVSERAQKTFLKTILYLEEHDINISGFSPRIDVLNENFCQMMIDEMQQYEKYPGNGNGKLLIMEEAVKDFVAFLLSSIAQRYNMPELIDKMVTDDGASYYYMRYIRDDRHKQLEQFLSMTCLKEEQKESRVQDIYSVLEKQVRNLYKRSVIRRAETLEKPDNMDFSKIQKGIQRYLEEKFAPLLAEDSDTIVDANLLQLTIGSELPLTEELYGYNDELFRGAIEIVAYQLWKTGKLRKLYRGKDIDDIALEVLLQKAKDHDVILGSEYALSPTDYRARKEYMDYLAESERSTCGGGKLALILTKGAVGVRFADVRVTVRNQTIEESKAIFNSETGKYTYEPSVGMAVELDKNELEKLLAQTRTVYMISARIGLKIVEETGYVGSAIIRDL